MNINFNFNYSKNLKINGDIRYQIDTISLLKKINSKLIWEEKNSLVFINCSKKLINNTTKDSIISSLFNKELNYLSRKILFDFDNKNLNIFSHYFFLKPKNNNFLCGVHKV